MHLLRDVSFEYSFSGIIHVFIMQIVSMKIAMPTVLRRLIVMLSLAMVWMPPVYAENQGLSVRAATVVLPPFVIDQDGVLTGFSIEIWNEISKRMGAKTTYQLMPSVKDVFDALRDGNADIAVSGLFYTSERDREFEFSYPILESGLQVMVRNSASGEVAAFSSLWRLLDLLFSRATLAWLGIALLFVVMAAHVAWLLERRHPDGMIPTQSYFPGIFYAMYWAAATLLTQAVDRFPGRWLVRTLSVLWMFVGISFVASYTAQLTTNLTVQQIRGAINGPDDLHGKRVATLSGGSAVRYLREHGIQVVEFAQTSEIYQALLDRRVDAVLLGAAGQIYYATHEGRGLVRVVGPEFNKNDVGFIFPEENMLRRKVNGALLSLREDGTYQRIHDKWVESPP